ncbi:MAG: hypothetical protein OWR52_10370 [Acidibacillus sp.]|uniref:Uncharacterized protein n=1 Tax=Sulfoacidibacillus ferrooxidans TaxID=2005001 RepID=A0A9X2AB40_9BACL|nr:hypothetical protein [Sulfoacidibacillus ferrooxidans]MCI0182289.1 hypothetical protein [Sulfoacidibacillus ferrooxidans]MCY0893898.1 hypothetical protein [Acidibacillus sp.]
MIKGRWSAHPISATDEASDQENLVLYAVRLLRDPQNGFVSEITNLQEYMDKHHVLDETVAIDRLQRDLRHQEKSNRIYLVKAQTPAHAVRSASQKAH